MKESSKQQANKPAEKFESCKAQELYLKLACPKCENLALVEWRQLPLLLQCPKCSNALWIDQGGHILSQHESGSIFVTCPRCRQKRQYPKGAGLKKVNCQTCSFKIPLEDSLHEASSGAAFEAEDSEKKTGAKKWKKELHLSPRAMIAVSACLAILFVMGIVWGIMALRPDQTLIDAADGFTAAIVSGDASKATQWVTSDQLPDFQRYMSMYPVHPATPQSGEREVRVLEYSSTQARVEVKYPRTLRDIQTQRQSWRRVSSDSWQFDATETLNRHNES